MNINEEGVQLRFNADFDMSSQTALQLDFTKPDGTALQKVTPGDTITVGGVQVSTSKGLFEANEYAIYAFVSGDVDQKGTWKVRLTYTDTVAGHVLTSKYPTTFEVLQ